MKLRWSLKSLIIRLFLVITLVVTGGLVVSHQTVVNASQNVYDLSEWQGPINDRKARGLKKEISFVILRAQYGKNYQDRQYQNNINQLNKHQVPYGVYSYSLYHNSNQARNEATSLYNRAPQAKFYVNDIEQNNAGRQINSATVAWAQKMKRLTTRPVVLYSYSSFIRQNLLKARHHYNAIWLADYTKRQPVTGYKYDLWQYTSHHYSKALRKRIDASILTSNKPISFWIGNHGNTDVVKPVQPTITKSSVKKIHVQHQGLKLTHRQLHEYHHEMNKISKTVKQGRRLSIKERKALRIYRIRHSHSFRL